MVGRLLKISIRQWSVELGNVLIDQVLTIQWECEICKIVYEHDATSLVQFLTKNIELDLQNLGSLFCTKCTQFAQIKTRF